MSWFNNVGKDSADQNMIIELTEYVADQSAADLYCKCITKVCICSYLLFYLQ